MVSVFLIAQGKDFDIGDDVFTINSLHDGAGFVHDSFVYLRLFSNFLGYLVGIVTKEDFDFAIRAE